MTYSFEEIYKEYQEKVIAFFLKRGCGEESYDLAQATFFKAYRNLKKFRNDCPFEFWLLRIARSIWQNHLRDKSAQKRSAETVPINEEKDAAPTLVSFTVHTSDPTNNALDGMIVGEKMKRLQKLVDRLPHKQRTVSMLHYFQERDFDEISTLLELNRSTVKSHLSQAKKRLNEWWRNEAFSEEQK